MCIRIPVHIYVFFCYRKSRLRNCNVCPRSSDPFCIVTILSVKSRRSRSAKSISAWSPTPLSSGTTHTATPSTKSPTPTALPSPPTSGSWRMITSPSLQNGASRDWPRRTARRPRSANSAWRRRPSSPMLTAPPLSTKGTRSPGNAGTGTSFCWNSFFLHTSLDLPIQLLSIFIFTVTVKLPYITDPAYQDSHSSICSLKVARHETNRRSIYVIFNNFF